MKMRKPLKHKGFINIPRRIILLLKEGQLNFSDFGFYIFLLQEADWFPPRNTFGCVPKTDIDLAIDSNCDPSTISRRKSKLKKLGLIEETVNGLIRIKNFEKYTARIASQLGQMEVANLQEDFAQTQSIIAETQLKNSELQQNKRTSQDFFRDSPFNERVSNDEDVSPDDIPF